MQTDLQMFNTTKPMFSLLKPQLAYRVLEKFYLLASLSPQLKKVLVGLYCHCKSLQLMGAIEPFSLQLLSVVEPQNLPTLIGASKPLLSSISTSGPLLQKQVPSFKASTILHTRCHYKLHHTPLQRYDYKKRCKRICQ